MTAADADDDAQHRQTRTQHIALDLLQRHQNGVAEHLGRLLIADFADHLAVAELQAALGVVGDVLFVRDRTTVIDVLRSSAGEKLHDLVAARGIEIAGGFVGEISDGCVTIINSGRGPCTRHTMTC